MNVIPRNKYIAGNFLFLVIYIFDHIVVLFVHSALIYENVGLSHKFHSR